MRKIIAHGRRLLCATPLLALTIVGCAGSAPSPAANETPASTSSAAAAPTASTQANASTLKTTPATPQAKPTRDAVRPQAKLAYTVKRGDTLWDIAAYFLKDPWLWPQIWYQNPNIANPHLIYPGDVIKLSYVQGHPRLQVSERVVRVSPHVRSEPLPQAVPTIPLSAISDFLAGPRIVDAKTLAGAPYVIALGEGRLLAANGAGVYVQDWHAGDPHAMSVVHAGRTYRDPDSGKVIGVEVDPVADAVISKESDPAFGELSGSKREVQIGDRLLARENGSFDADFEPRAPREQIHGHIISVFDGVSQIARNQIVTLDLGRHDQMEKGDVLSIMQAGRVVKDPYTDANVALPERKAGSVMIFKVYDQLSYALVMQATRTVHVMDVVKTPTRGG